MYVLCDPRIGELCLCNSVDFFRLSHHLRGED